jgi:hypothetical protein
MISRDFYKKPVFYYIFIPAVAALWPCSVAFVSLPHSRQAFINEQKSYSDANEVMFNILAIDPDRSKNANVKNPAKTFDYFTAVGDIARSCNISTPTISSQPARTVENRKMQEATVTLQKVNISSFANFLSALQRRWANLECESIILDKQKGLPDVWKATVKFRYHF